MQLALSASARLIGLALVLQSVELLQLRHKLADDGIWRYEVLAAEHARLPLWLRWPLRWLLPYRPFVGVLLTQLIAASWVLGSGQLHAMPLLLGCVLLTCVRFRGTFNGGSDCMTLVVLLALSVAACASHHPTVRAGCIIYIAVQSTLSYAIAGLTKLKEASWRDGRALRQLLRSPQYAAPERLRGALTRPAALKLLSWSLIGFECGFVLAWFDPRVCLAVLGTGALFHLSNALCLGLNRFFFAWLASYPALLYVGQFIRP